MIRTVLFLVRDLLHFVALASSSQTSLAAENLFLRKQLSVLCRAEGQAAAPERCRPSHPRLARTVDRLATASRRDATGHARAVAPAGIPAVLALEVTAA
jgi:hypothetical protein